MPEQTTRPARRAATPKPKPPRPIEQALEKLFRVIKLLLSPPDENDKRVLAKDSVTTIVDILRNFEHSVFLEGIEEGLRIGIEEGLRIGRTANAEAT